MSQNPQIEEIVAAMKQSFRDVVAGSSGKLFEDTGVTMPGDHVWERYAQAALSASQEAAAPSEEPVAWMVRSANYPLEYFSNEDNADIWANSPGVLDAVVSPLFASPAVAPVAKP